MTATTYEAFLASKRRLVGNEGIEPGEVHPSLFPFQRDIVRWAVRKGRAAIFADVGLGKTRMQVEWARLLGQRTLILSPLAVAHQTIREAAAIGVEVVYAKDQSEAGSGISITNYERLERFDAGAFGAVVLDESSILANFSGITKRLLVEMFAETPYRLCCTATPAPNDLEELCNHADFLGWMSPAEMRSTFFIADSRGEFMRYRLKGHARTSFFRWLASWSLALKRPSDLGYDDAGFILPPLEVRPHFVGTSYQPEGRLFSLGLDGVGEAAAVRRATLDDRIEQALELVLAEPDEPWLIWCGLNDEADAMRAALDDAVEVRGNDSTEDKAARLLAFADGGIKTLITKVGVAGFGLNFQRCARMAFVGLGYSWQSYYQALGRCHRFGQTRPVLAHVVLSEPERPVWDAVMRKADQHRMLTGGLLAGMVEHSRSELFAGTSSGDSYDASTPMEVPSWLY